MGDSSRIAFVGAGQMGMPMVRRLVDAGRDVVVHARREEVRAECAAAGISATADLREAVAGASAVVVCVFSDTQLRDVALGPDGFLDAMAPGALVVIHTTGSPATARLLADARSDVCVVEAPVSGAARDIEAGQITVLLAGADADVAAAREVVDAYAGSTFHLGPLGAAQAVKLLNNALFAANMQLVAEVERLTASFGVDWAQASAALQHSSGASRAMGVVSTMGSVQAMVDAGGHYLVKDVAAVVEVAQELGLDLGQLEAVNRDGPLPFLD